MHSSFNGKGMIAFVLEVLRIGYIAVTYRISNPLITKKYSTIPSVTMSMCGVNISKNYVMKLKMYQKSATYFNS